MSQFKHVFLINGTCKVGGQALPPTDLSAYFRGGLNRVQATLKDKCGGGVSATALWLLP